MTTTSEPTPANYKTAAITGYFTALLLILLGVPFALLAGKGSAAWWIPFWILWGPALLLTLYSITLDIRGFRKGRA